MPSRYRRKGSIGVLVLGTLLVSNHAPSVVAQFAPATGETRVLTGRVVTADADAVPLRGARLTVAAGGRAPAIAISDHEGTFRVPVPVDGQWTLRITKAGFAPGDLSAEAAATREPAIVRLTRGAAITGRVLDARGQPASGVTVIVRAAVCPEPCVQPSAAPPALSGFSVDTNDLGEFRIGSLPAGQYEVRVPRGLAGVLAQAGTIMAQTLQQRLENDPGMVQLPGVSVFMDSLDNQAGTADGRSALPVPGDLQTVPGNLASLFGLGQPDASDASVRLAVGEEASLVLSVGDTQQRLQASFTAGIGAGFMTALAQQASPQGQTGQQEPPGAVRGRITGPTGQPIASAVVRLEPVGGAAVRMAVSNESGQYEIASVPPGTYRLVVTRQGLVPVEYGQSRALQPGAPITVRAGETVERIDVALPPGGAISGRVFDVYGEPLEGVSVQVLERRLSGGRIELRPANGVLESRTDDRGAYRIHGLLPGTYYVVAEDRTALMQAVAASVAEPPAGLASAAAAPLLTAITPDRIAQLSGMFAGDVGRASPAIFYPGTASPGEGVAIRLEPGSSGSGIDIAFVSVATGRIRGTALDVSGQPWRGAIALTASRRSGGIAVPARRTAPGPDGSFEFLHLPPGEYVVQTESGPGLAAMTAMTRGLDPTGPAGPRAAGVDPEFGTAFVTVARDDTATVVLRAMPTTQIAGRVVADPDDGTLPMAAIRVGVAPADLDHAPAATSARATPRDDGRFVLPGLIGPHRFELVQAPPGWYLKSALIDGLDAADYPVTFGAVSQHGEALIVVGRAAEIGGRATDDRGAPAAGGSVVVFSTDPGQWYDRSRHLALTRPAADGTFRVEGLPAGEYWVAAVEGIPASEWQHPDVLRALVSGARRVRLADAQRGTADLRLMRLPGL